MGELSHVRETHCLNIVSRRGKAGPKGYKSDVYRIGNVVAEVIGEPVQAILTVDRVHSREVGGVDAISKHLHTHAWDHKTATGRNWCSS